MDSRILHYEFVTGESVNITVSAEIAEVIYDSRRMEHASNERSRYHTAFSLDSEDYEGTNLVSEKTPDDLMEELEDREHLLDCLAHLSENQRQRILMLAQGIHRHSSHIHKGHPQTADAPCYISKCNI